MSQKVVTTCDHCSKECDGDQYASIGRWEEPKTITFGKTFHGCTKEHLAFVVAKAFGIGVDGRCAGIITAKDLEISDKRERVTALETQIQHLNRSLDEKSKLIGTDRADATRAILENERLQSRVADLEKQLAAANDPASITDNTKPTKPLASAGAAELIDALGLVLPEEKCGKCNDGPEKHRITVSVKWCNHSEVIAEYFPSLTGPKKPTKPVTE